MFRRPVFNVTRLSYFINTRWTRSIQSVASASVTSGSYIYNPGSEPLCYDNLGDVIAQTAEKYPDRAAVKSVHENVTITYEELLKKADSLGCALRAQGLEKGDRLGIWSQNSVTFIVALVAAARAGLISVLMNPVYEKTEISFCIKKTGMKSLLIGERLPNRNHIDILRQLLPELRGSKPGTWKSKNFTNLTSIISVGGNNLAGTTSYNSLITGSGSHISQYVSEVKPEDGCLIHFTSGTTGDPKAALDSHLGVVNNMYFSGVRNLFHEGHQNICVQVPLFHALGSVVSLLGGIRHGATLVLPAPTYNLHANVKALLSENCTAIVGTPTMFVDMLVRLKAMGVVSSKLRMALVGGASCSPKLIKDMQMYLKADSVKCVYGLTECTGSVFVSMKGDSIDTVAETVGYIMDHTEAKVVDDNGAIVPFDSLGELLVRGYTNMICYWDDPGKTRQVLDEEGWLRTGDKFTISKDGYGRVVGRLKDIIVRGGENIAPKEIEDLLNTHPDIVESQVVGVPDERLGEELCAVVRVRNGTSVTPDVVRRHCTGHLARFKIPRIVRIIEEFPKTASGKIQKYRLKQMVETGKL